MGIENIPTSSPCLEANPLDLRRDPTLARTKKTRQLKSTIQNARMHVILPKASLRGPQTGKKFALPNLDFLHGAKQFSVFKPFISQLRVHHCHISLSSATIFEPRKHFGPGFSLRKLTSAQTKSHSLTVQLPFKQDLELPCGGIQGALYAQIFRRLLVIRATELPKKPNLLQATGPKAWIQPLEGSRGHLDVGRGRPNSATTDPMMLQECVQGRTNPGHYACLASRADGGRCEERVSCREYRAMPQIEGGAGTLETGRTSLLQDNVSVCSGQTKGTNCGDKALMFRNSESGRRKNYRELQVKEIRHRREVRLSGNSTCLQHQKCFQDSSEAGSTLQV
eukprot:RCo029322